MMGIRSTIRIMPMMSNRRRPLEPLFAGVSTSRCSASVLYVPPGHMLSLNTLLPALNGVAPQRKV
jgi:hypothetical protein